MIGRSERIMELVVADTPVRLTRRS